MVKEVRLGDALRHGDAAAKGVPAFAAQVVACGAVRRRIAG